MNKKDITAIVDELITLEPSLAKHTATLEKQITAIVSAKPDTKFTQSFKKKLLTELRSNLAGAPSTSSPFETMNKWFYAIGGAAVASFALYVTVIHPVVPMPLGESDGVMEENGPAMQRMAMNNKAMDSNDMAESEMPTPEPSMANTRPQSGGGGGMALGYGGGGIPPMADSRMIAPGEPYGYSVTEYIYDGDIEIPESAKAFKRTPLKGSQKADLLTGTFVEQLLDVSEFRSMSVINVSLQESGSEPMMVNIDFQDGSLSMNRQINYASRPESQCRDEACYQRFRMKKSDMLSDDRTVDLATNFLDGIGVDLDTYGEPMIQDDWAVRYETATDKANFYFPEQVTVTFPYLVNGLPVYDEWGNASGLSVTVDMKLRNVTGAWGMRVMNLSDHPYTVETDADVVREVARMGSINGYPPEGADTKQAQLAEPRLVYAAQYHWDEKTQLGYEVYLPALAFPVLKMPEGSYEHRKAVVVPLDAELLESKQQMPPFPMPMPMPVEPLMDPATMPRDAVMEE